MLKLSHISKSFDGVKAVQNFSAEFKPGRVYALVGPNGAGKTTLLNLINGFIPPDQGKTIIKGKEVTKRPPFYVAKQGVGRLFQDIRIFPKMKSIDNLLLSKQFNAEENPLKVLLQISANRKITNDFQRKALNQLNNFGIENKTDSYAEDLSYGQEKLLSLSRLLLGDFDIFLLDEPVAGVNPQIKEVIYDLIKRLVSQEKLVIIVEHEMEAVRQVADEVLFISEGKLLKRGTPQEILSDETVIKEYIGLSDDWQPQVRVSYLPTIERQPILETNDIHAAYYKCNILHGISFKIFENEIVSLIGPNGAGKSTFLKVLAGVLSVNKGEVIYKGDDITHLNARERVKRGIGYFVQGGEIFTDLEVDENLVMATLDMKYDEKMEQMEKIFSLFPVLRTKKDVRAGLLSGGERQMLALSMILMKQPKLLLWLDEPSAGLSPKLTKEMLGKVWEIKENFNTSILLVEQRVTEALAYSERVYLLKEGRIVRESFSGEVLGDKEELEKIYMGNHKHKPMEV